MPSSPPPGYFFFLSSLCFLWMLTPLSSSLVFYSHKLGLDVNLTLFPLLKDHCSFWIIFHELWKNALNIVPPKFSVLLEFSRDARWPSHAALCLISSLSQRHVLGNLLRSLMQFSHFLHCGLICWLAHLLRDFFLWQYFFLRSYIWFFFKSEYFIVFYFIIF